MYRKLGIVPIHLGYFLDDRQVDKKLHHRDDLTECTVLVPKYSLLQNLVSFKPPSAIVVNNYL
jgi:hypothetical protein